MWTKPTSLYTFTPSTHSHFTFYYVPLGSRAQRQRREAFTEHQDVYLYLEEVVSERLVMFSETLATGRTVWYSWPQDDYQEQAAIFMHLPDEAVMELGAYMIGAAFQRDRYGFAYFLTPEDQVSLVMA